ncbi:Uu.00g075300.m01.CDS01 [Anthostomella pinea]|uniref:Uu.00g075300.m01.CDS01 n=1 Tax=Anthostomella pinea TaxID=933095 RepID=A0AAI8VW85_9PEZI|nr:Uu.00g075300.m01.CDS01 [Anthostomella pinea]
MHYAKTALRLLAASATLTVQASASERVPQPWADTGSLAVRNPDLGSSLTTAIKGLEAPEDLIEFIPACLTCFFWSQIATHSALKGSDDTDSNFLEKLGSGYIDWLMHLCQKKNPGGISGIVDKIIELVIVPPETQHCDELDATYDDKLHRFVLVDGNGTKYVADGKSASTFSTKNSDAANKMRSFFTSTVFIEAAEKLVKHFMTKTSQSRAMF